MMRRTCSSVTRRSNWRRLAPVPLLSAEGVAAGGADLFKVRGDGAGGGFRCATTFLGWGFAFALDAAGLRPIAARIPAGGARALHDPMRSRLGHTEAPRPTMPLAELPQPSTNSVAH